MSATTIKPHVLRREELLAAFGYPKARVRVRGDKAARSAQALTARMDRELYIGGLRRVN